MTINSINKNQEAFNTPLNVIRTKQIRMAERRNIIESIDENIFVVSSNRKNNRTTKITKRKFLKKWFFDYDGMSYASSSILAIYNNDIFLGYIYFSPPEFMYNSNRRWKTFDKNWDCINNNVGGGSSHKKFIMKDMEKNPNRFFVKINQDFKYETVTV